MIRGTRIIEGQEAILHTWAIETLSKTVASLGYEEVILPSLWEQRPFINKAGAEIISQMWTFKDKGGRDVCLIPEATAVVCEYFKPRLKSMKLPHRVFYKQRCYRYERPQKGRYREFTQFGIECLGHGSAQDECVEILRRCLDAVGVKYEIDEQVSRGLDYYTQRGFEARCDYLGAQKQIAGGGTYEGGVGFAIGVDRLLMAHMVESEEF